MLFLCTIGYTSVVLSVHGVFFTVELFEILLCEEYTMVA